MGSRFLSPFAGFKILILAQDPAAKRGGGEGDSSEEEDEDEEDEEDESSEESSDDAQAGPTKSEMSREERKAEARKRKEAAIAKKKANQAAPGDMPSSSDESDGEDEDMPANPNHTAKAQKQAATAPTDGAGNDSASGKKKADTTQLSRREREALQAQQAKERYQKLHAEGKTDEARADLERLKLVRERREAEAARKKAEAEERAELEREKKEQLERMDRQAAIKANKLGNKKKKGAK